MKLHQLAARTISPLGIGRRRKKGVRLAKGRRAEREVWASRSVYKLLLFIFRPRPGNKPVTPPFLKNRPLSEAEFRGAQEEYVLQRHRRRDPLEVTPKPGRDFSKIFPFFSQSADSGDWEALKMIGKAMFASKPQQQRERDARIPGTLAWASTRGPRSRRTFLAKALRALPQAKNKFSGIEVMRIAAYRRGREFLCAFLVGEARALDSIPSDADIADTLAQLYPWIGLTAEQIRAVLAHPDKQPDLDTAAEFHISPSYVRRLL